jgi:organic radical activating enzyme
MQQGHQPITGLHIEPTNICTLKCAGCARTRFIQQWPQHWRNHSIDINTLMQFLDIDLQGVMVELCGNYGDPIYHPELLSLVSQLKQRGARIGISTNGSYQTEHWWQQLTLLLDSEDFVQFSVDGTPENFTQYRENADWDSIEMAMRTCAGASVQTVWKYIPFAYNTNTIEQAQQLSESLGIDQFRVVLSDRFDSATQHLLPDEKFLGSRYRAQQQWKQTHDSALLEPKCHRGNEHYVSAEGYYVSCCYLHDHRFYYKTPFGKHKSLYSIKETTLTNILSRPDVVNFYQTLPDQPGCQFNCSKS